MGVQSPVRREEDLRLLRGKGRYVDDVREPNQAHGYVLRSPHAHARIVALDVRRARIAPGVLCVLTGADRRGVIASTAQLADVASPPVQYRQDIVARFRHQADIDPRSAKVSEPF